MQKVILYHGTVFKRGPDASGWLYRKTRNLRQRHCSDQKGLTTDTLVSVCTLVCL